jgi:NTE family protein
MNARHRLCCGLLLSLVVAVLAASPLMPAGASETAARPKVGLVLSGGGARGAAHIGVIKVLEELRVPIDCIAGTSMGSIVGGLYASGMTVKEMEQALTSIDWGDVFDDDPPRPERSFRRKRDDDTFLVKAKPGLKNGKLALPKGAIQGQKLNLLLDRLALPVADIRDFDDLKIPYRAVATDIGTGEPVVLASGGLSQAMRASMSIPSALAPVEIEGKLLVDGGVSNNLPMDVARETCADVLIVVDIGTPLTPTEELQSVLGITEQLTTIMTRQNTARQLSTLRPEDVLIEPELGDISTTSFEKAAQAIPIGVRAALDKRQELERLALPETDHRAYPPRTRFARVTTQPVIDFVRVDNDSRLADAVIAARLRVKPGDRLDVAELEKDLGVIYGLGNFQRVDYSLVQENGKTGLVVHAVAKEWGPDYLQFGLNLEASDEGDSAFNLGLGYTMTEVNSAGGEWRILGSFGDDLRLFTDFYQPFGADYRYFVVPEFSYERVNFGVFEDQEQIAEYRVTRTRFGLAGGINLADYGELRLGYRRAWGSASRRIGEPRLPEGDFDDGGLYVRWWTDTLDNVNFPRQGANTRVEYTLSRESLGANSDFQTLTLSGAWPLTYGRNTFIPRVILSGKLDGELGPQNRFLLGGFLNLSGFQSRQLSGNYAGLAQLAYLRRLDDTSAAFTLPIYVGASVEAGNAWEDNDDLSFESLFMAGSVFLGLDTPIGPLYLGGGYAEGGHASAYLSLGRPF